MKKTYEEISKKSREDNKTKGRDEKRETPPPSTESLVILTGVLLNTQSRLPSSVLNLMANPLGSLAVSALPLSPPTVENRTVARTFFPTDLKRAAEVMSERSWVVSK